MAKRTAVTKATTRTKSFFAELLSRDQELSTLQADRVLEAATERRVVAEWGYDERIADNYFVLNDYGWGLAELGRFDEAQQTLEKNDSELGASRSCYARAGRRHEASCGAFPPKSCHRCAAPRQLPGKYLCK